MKVFLQSIKLYTLLLATLFLGGCSQEDDIEEIFCSGQWSLVNFFETKNWESTNSHGDTPLITKPETSSKNWISITFNDDGSPEIGGVGHTHSTDPLLPAYPGTANHLSSKYRTGSHKR